jgi:hypothetical protein
MRGILCVAVLMSAAMLRPSAATKTQVYHALAACQEVQSVLLGLALAADEEDVFWECMDEVQRLQALIDDGKLLWEEVERARRARGTRRSANGADLRIAAANGYVRIGGRILRVLISHLSHV